MGNLRQKYSDEDWDELVKKSKQDAPKLIQGKKPFELYLIILGERSTDYSYTPEIIYEHIEYFRKCWENDMSQYKALEWFYYEQENKLCESCGNKTKTDE